MSGELALTERRRLLQAQLQEQRERIARTFASSHAHSAFPRSLTMRLLIHRPELLIRLAQFVVGARTARSLSMIVDLAWTLRSASKRTAASTRSIS